MTRKQIASMLFGGLLAVAAAVGFMGGALVHMAGTAPHSDARLTDTETRILAQVLAHPLPDGGYNVVMPETITVPQWADDPGMPYDAKDFIATGFRKKGVDARALLDRLYEINAKSVRLTLSSAPGDGYVVDDGSYEKYFQFGGGGWERLQREHPQAANRVRLARPAYDEASGLFLAYMRADTRDGGRGAFMLYRNEGGAVKLVDIEHLWDR